MTAAKDGDLRSTNCQFHLARQIHPLLFPAAIMRALSGNLGRCVVEVSDRSSSGRGVRSRGDTEHAGTTTQRRRTWLSATNNWLVHSHGFSLHHRDAGPLQKLGEERCEYAENQAEDACKGKDDRATGADMLN